MSIRNLFGLKKENAPASLITIEERNRLKGMERFKNTQTVLFGNTFKITDAPTFLSSLDEILVREIYKLNTDEKAPLMIDCGANIGLASLYFKKQYPDSKVIAFEPDPVIFQALQENVRNQKLTHVTLRNEAIADVEKEMSFHMEGGHSGMIVSQNDSAKVVMVRSVRLKDFMVQFDRIDFLKIDIEGYERLVIPDIASELFRVKNLFFEYHSFLDEPQLLDELLAIIRRSGMKYYIKESANKRFPFIDREIFLKMDLILNVFCYRD